MSDYINRLPLLVFVSFGLWGVVVALYRIPAGVLTPPIFEFLMVAGVVGAIVACVLMLGRQVANRIVCLFVGLCLGCAVGSMSLLVLQTQTERCFEYPKADTFKFVAQEDGIAGDFGMSCTAQVKTSSGTEMLVKLNLPQSATVRCWDIIEGRATITQPKEGALEYYRTNGLVGSATLYSCEVQKPSGVLGMISSARQAGIHFFHGSDERASMLLRALVFADRDDLRTSELYQQVKQVGLAHMVAVSGAHLMILTLFVGIAARALRLPKTTTVVVQVVFLLFYLALTGAPLSAVRACIMALCALSSYFVKRRAFPLNSLCLCIIVMVVTRPMVALSLSFTLSTLATLGIILLASPLSAWFSALTPFRLTALDDALALTCAANLFTLPITIPTFGMLPLISFLSNILVTPLFSLLCVGGMLCFAVSLFAAAFASLVLSFMMPVASLVVQVIALLSAVPYGCIPADTTTLGLLVTALVPLILFVCFGSQRSSKMRVVALIASLALVPVLVFCGQLFAPTRIIALDVGQGDAILLQSGGRALLVDIGTNDSDVLTALGRYGITHLDAVLITHPDDDHCGSIKAVESSVVVDRVLVADDLLTCDDDNCKDLLADIGDCPVQGLSCDDVLSFGALDAKVIWPKRYADDGGNADSVVLQVICDVDGDGVSEGSALLTGDAESQVLEKLAEEQRLPAIDILKVGHHGSKVSVNREVLETMHPSVALVSVGANNRYGHPTQTCMDLLSNQHVAVFRTDTQGDVVCKLGGERVSVTTLR